MSRKINSKKKNEKNLQNLVKVLNANEGTMPADGSQGKT
jgi:hypothetical protein